MHAVIESLLTGEAPVSVDMWSSFWDILAQGATPDCSEKAVALLATLVTQVPDHASVGALLDSLDERREHPPDQDAVNVVGTGGGPSTFNMSTASAFVAAALGVRIVKSGSRAYSSRCGSIDLLELLGVPLVRSHDEAAAELDRSGVAFTGQFVYPSELTLLARRVLPVDMRTLGRFFNSIGPFLAAVPARAQVTGVASPAMLPLLEHLAASHCRRRVWLCFNDAGVDELVSFDDNVILRHDGTKLRLAPGELGLTQGSLADLRPAATPDGLVRQFRALLRGEGPPAAVESIALNAASLAVASGLVDDWGEALHEATRAIERGYAVALLDGLVQLEAAA